MRELISLGTLFWGFCLLITGFLYIAVVVGWGTSVPVSASRDLPDAADMPATSALQHVPETVASAAFSRPLLFPERRPVQAHLNAGIASPAQAAGTGAFDYSLTGIVIAPNARMAILQGAGGSKPLRIALDARIPDTEWRLINITPRSATFGGPNESRTLSLRRFDGQGGIVPTVVTQPTSSGRSESPGPVQPDRHSIAQGGPQPPVNVASSPMPRSATPVPPAPAPTMTPLQQQQEIQRQIDAARRAQQQPVQQPSRQRGF